MVLDPKIIVSIETVIEVSRQENRCIRTDEPLLLEVRCEVPKGSTWTNIDPAKVANKQKLHQEIVVLPFHRSLYLGLNNGRNNIDIYFRWQCLESKIRQVEDLVRERVDVAAPHVNRRQNAITQKGAL